MRMSKKKETVLVPRMRFPKFKNSGNWTKKPLCQIGDLVSGLTYSPDDVRETGLLVLRSSNIKNSAIVLDDNVYVRTDIGGANLSLENDILICVRNGSKALIGKNAMIPKNLPLCTHGAFMTIFRAEFPQFVFQLFQSEAYEKQVKADLGATINSINSSQLKKYIFCIPNDRKEQKKIADCLASLDNLITAENKKLEALRAHKKGLMQKLFPGEGKTVPEWRFPEFMDSGEWETNVFRAYIKLYRGSSPRPIQHYLTKKGGVNWIKIGDTKNADGFSIKNVEEQITHKGAKKSRHVNIGELILANSMSYGKTYIVEIDGCIYDGWFVLREYEYFFDKQFLLQQLNSDDMQKQYISLSAGGVVQNISSDIVYATFLKRPQIEEQKKITTCLAQIDELITTQTEKIEALKQHKKGLMQGLFPSAQEVFE
jgi:type I restriction enzyme S subunit